MSRRIVLMRGLPYFVGLLAPALSCDELDFRGFAIEPRAESLWRFLKAHAVYFISAGIRSRLAELALTFRKRVVMHWGGTDVLNAVEAYNAGLGSRRIIGMCEHWATTTWIAQELAAIGVKAKIVPYTALNFPSDVPPLPRRFTVLTYLPESRPEFYGSDSIIALARDFPNVQFTVLASTAASPWLKHESVPANVRALGSVRDLDSVYREATVLVRLTKHDGLSFMVAEALARGRYILWRYPVGPHPAIITYEQARGELGCLLRLHNAGKLRPNYRGAQWANEYLAPARIVANLRAEFKRLLHV